MKKINNVKYVKYECEDILWTAKCNTTKIDLDIQYIHRETLQIQLHCNTLLHRVDELSCSHRMKPAHSSIISRSPPTSTSTFSSIALPLLGGRLMRSEWSHNVVLTALRWAGPTVCVYLSVYVYCIRVCVYFSVYVFKCVRVCDGSLSVCLSLSLSLYIYIYICVSVSLSVSLSVFTVIQSRCKKADSCYFLVINLNRSQIQTWVPSRNE